MHIKDRKLLAAKPLSLAISTLLLLNFVSYHGVFENRFITFFDDNNYVTENSVVQDGLTLEGFKWAFTTLHAANYHPVTWLSHMADVQFFGNNPGWHHFINTLLHSLNTVTLFIFLLLMTSAFWKSLIVSALFSVHPLHVEAVAWISERKELLSTFFGLLSLISYYYYVSTSRTRGYILALTLFLLSLMSKPMLVTLPCLLILLDYWPLNRNPVKYRFRIIIEKIPFLLLSTLSALLTIHSQKSWGAVKMIEDIPVSLRLTNALISYGTYLGKTLLPVNLAVFYPYTKESNFYIPFIFSILLLVSITWIVIKKREKFPVYTVGWLWYLGTLLPVIGIIQVGNQSMADRYTYFPLTGIFLIVVWGFEEVAEKIPKPKITCTILSVSVIFACVSITKAQVKYWKNNLTLFKRAVDITKDNSLANNHLGAAYLQEKKLDEAEKHFLTAIEIDPDYAAPHVNLANALMIRKKIPAAVEQYKKALRIKEDAPFSRYNLGVALLSLKKTDEAKEEFQKATLLKPDFTPPYLALGALSLSLNEISKAKEYFNRVISIEPHNLAAKAYLKRIR